MVAPMVVLFFVAFAWSDPIPHLINYQGVLTDDAGNPLNAPQNLTFRIYNLESGGSRLWGETQNNVPVENGLFNVILGSVNPLDLPFDEDYWLEIEAGISDTLLPRVKQTSVGYAYGAQWADTSDYSLHAKEADTAFYAVEAVSAETGNDWTVMGNDMYSAVSGNAGIGTTTPLEKLHVNGKVYIASMDATAAGSPVQWYNGRLWRHWSSEKYKNDIQPLETDFLRVLKTQRKSFIDKTSGERNIGFIAEEFDELGLNDLVIYRDGEPDALKYELVSLYLLEVVKDRKAENEELKRRMEVLESKE